MRVDNNKMLWEPNILWECRLDQFGNMRIMVCYGVNDERIEWHDKTKAFYAYVFANDREHAEKKAQDMIAEYKARKEGIC